jgi:uncharacterized membrane protein HdeD (DUF308 family)
MELKYYGKPWLQAFKGGFYILLGILSMLQIYGSLYSMAIFFSFFIGLSGFLLIVAPFLLKTKINRVWNFILGVLNLFFVIFILFKLNGTRSEIFLILVIWMLFNAVAELIEAAILIYRKNAFFALFLIHALLSLLLGFGFNSLHESENLERLFNMGLIALVFGIVNELSAFLLKSVKKPE